MIEPLLLAATQVSTFAGAQVRTKASGFYFARDGRLFLVTSRHVLLDEPNAHAPDRIEIEVHTDASDLTQSIGFSILLYQNGNRAWTEARACCAEDVDVAAVEIDRAALPASTVLRAFTRPHLRVSIDEVEVGAPLLIVGVPLGMQDMVHHLPVARQAMIASSFGLRFQGRGYFLTDARTHRGMSGAPVVMRWPAPEAVADDLPWKLLGVHSARLDMVPRDHEQDETLGLNCAWYASVLDTLTAPAAAGNDSPRAAARNATAIA
jgi:hypothetical protein